MKDERRVVAKYSCRRIIRNKIFCLFCVWTEKRESEHSQRRRRLSKKSKNEDKERERARKQNRRRAGVRAYSPSGSFVISEERELGRCHAADSAAATMMTMINFC
eukprot:scaffold1248_cov170-Amphora_coffeaeformis.AAC.8